MTFPTIYINSILEFIILFVLTIFRVEAFAVYECLRFLLNIEKMLLKHTLHSDYQGNIYRRLLNIAENIQIKYL